LGALTKFWKVSIDKLCILVVEGGTKPQTDANECKQKANKLKRMQPKANRSEKIKRK